MFTQIAAIVFSAAALVAAVPAPNQSNSYACSSGSNYCCTSVKNINSTSGYQYRVVDILDTLSAEGQCMPINILGLSGATCNSQAACCDGQQNGGTLINVSCNPVNF